MLELKHITKRYVSSDTYVDALKGISLTFRNNEFVSILGPSGCGKTTLLNIIGGLDKYSSGDLIIDGVSTKDYKDNDWDNYRNHKIGFVFQSYNLIPHQTILKNVELALTISGVKKNERFIRAKEVLKKVGLEGLEKKRPNQLSGGQMQRVAIARALVNNPSILLADEPTGALDSETSIQVMDLLKEVAKDRLVIMVTHNPELADLYSSRIVKMKDGLLIDDSNVCNDHDKLLKKEEIVKEKQSAMKLTTASGLSFSNLLSKLKRTILITIAGSIGIVGVSAVLAVSTGVKGYIRSMQEDMLSSYPLTIAEESLDYSSLMGGLSNSEKKELLKFDPSTQVGLDSMIDYLMSTYKDMTNVKTNDINENFLEYLKGINKDDIAATNYNYAIDVTNNIFTSWNKDYLDTPEKEIISLNGLTNRYIAELQTVDGFSDYASYVSLFTDFMKQLPGGQEYISSQYDLLGNSRYATKDNEIMLVVNEDTTFTDLYLAQLGYYDHDEFINIAKRAIDLNKLSAEEKTIAKIQEIKDATPYKEIFNYEELIGKKLYYFPHESLYKYGEYTDEPQITVKADLVNSATQETYSLQYGSMMGMEGLVCNYSKGSDTSMFYLQRTGNASTTDANTKDIMYGTWMGQFDDSTYIKFVISESECKVSLNTNPMAIMSDAGTLLTGSPYTESSTEAYYYDSIIDNNFINDPSNKCTELEVVGILRIKNGLSFGSLSTGVYYTKALSDKYISDASSTNNGLINDPNHGLISYIGSDKEKEAPFKCYVKFNYLDFTNDSNNKVETSGFASALNSDMMSSFAGLFSGLTGVDYLDTDATALRSLSGLKLVTIRDENDNITGYDTKLYPQEISIYPTSFESKDNITSYLDKWNSEETLTISNIQLTKEDRSEISYSDTIGLIIGVIDVLINTITIALVAFTSLSLLVSCFMIAVITYISVMERIKEIGIIRSLGGRKKDISRLFISETFMTGLFSGVFGIAFTYLLCFIANTATKNLVTVNIAILKPSTAIIMVLLSIFLSVISGIIPSMKSANQDPVTALRTE